jgi:NAD(P)H-nitrite reductase large subunit
MAISRWERGEAEPPAQEYIRLERYYESRGVKLLKKESIVSLQDKGSPSSGRTISCDMAVAGVGALPVTELFGMSGLAVENGIMVNEYL